MKRSTRVSPYGLLAVLAMAAGSVLALHGAAAQEREEFKNLKVLPRDISRDELRNLMSQFTRALGVHCDYCHATKPGEQHLDFALDDKPEKKTARVMMQMTRELNEKYIAKLEDHSTPPIQVQCVTCHRGIAHPRPLADVLKLAYAKGGIDSTRARYAALRDRYYGRAAYDFGEVPLTEVGLALADSGHVADAADLFALNVEMNPKSAFAKRQAATANILLAFTKYGADSGVAVYQHSKAQISEQPRDLEGAVANVGERLGRLGRIDAAIAAYKLNVAEHPQSGDAFADLGAAYLKRGGRNDKKLAIDAYLRAVSLDSTNTDAVKQLESLKVAKSRIQKARADKR
jgi:tetratricopeptide (TPR) repeat protein